MWLTSLLPLREKVDRAPLRETDEGLDGRVPCLNATLNRHPRAGGDPASHKYDFKKRGPGLRRGDGDRVSPTFSLKVRREQAIPSTHKKTARESGPFLRFNPEWIRT